MEMDKAQQLQDESYTFPYHHIPEYKNWFNQCFNYPWGINYVSTIEFLIKKLKQEEFESLIDIGCGDGRLTKELKELFSNKTIEGIDYSERSIKLAKILYNEEIYHCINILENSHSQQYNIALLIEVFEHIHPEQGNEFLKAVANLISKNGLLILTVPHCNAPLDRRHYRHFSIQSLSECLKPYFDIVEIILFEKKDKRKDFIDLLLTNKLFILNNGRLKNLIYNYYKKNLFAVIDEKVCKRIYIKAKVRK